MGMPSGPELIIILFIIILLFGAKKLPDLAKGLGKGINEFKRATNGDYDEEKGKSEKSKTEDKEKAE